MTPSERIDAFVSLGKQLDSIPQDRYEPLKVKVMQNPWFTSHHIDKALEGISLFLNKESLTAWCDAYQIKVTHPKTVGVVMAGNIPLVGFHDFLSVLIAGHKIKIKLSSDDKYLLPYICDLLININPEFKEFINIADNIKNIDAAIATGSNNTFRYFNYYFKDIPHIIRKNMSSCAIISEDEPKENREALADDIFSFFGLGCRNVSKVFIPKGYHVPNLIDCFNQYAHIIDNHKYANNYIYQRGLYQMNLLPHWDSDYAIFTLDDRLHAPIGVIYLEEYDSIDSVKHKINGQLEEVQCVIGETKNYQDAIPFGKAQSPALNDYADRIDTMEFLSNL